MAEFEAARRSQEAHEQQEAMMLEVLDSNQSELNSGANRPSTRTTVKSQFGHEYVGSQISRDEFEIDRVEMSASVMQLVVEISQGEIAFNNKYGTNIGH
jgi:methanogenic corrinoid protein MtbC1